MPKMQKKVSILPKPLLVEKIQKIRSIAHWCNAPIFILLLKLQLNPSAQHLPRGVPNHRIFLPHL